MMLFSNMMQLILCLVFMQLCLIAESTYPEEDRIIALPMQPNVTFQQFSGYITVDDKTNRSFFYYFVEAETDPRSKPLVLWRAGGPGCGTVAGSGFSASGPFRINGGVNGPTLFRNKHSFNKVANVLYMDSPAGAGFSYSPDESLNNSISDELIARDDLVFLQRWLSKFSDYKNRDLYLGGQSYAGHTVPALAELILQTELKDNLKGIMLGSPLLDFTSDFEEMPKHLWSRGIISDDTYELLTTSSCKYLQYFKEYHVELSTPIISGYRSPACVAMHKRLNFEFQSYQGFISADVTEDRCTLESDKVSVEEPELSRCSGELAATYIEKENVRKALHVRVRYQQCNPNIYANYNSESMMRPMMPTLGILIRSGVRVLIVSGDQDTVIPLISTRKLVDKLAKDMKLETTVHYSPWLKSLTTYQIGGWMQIYGQGKLNYATIKGGDHSFTGKSTESAFVLLQGLLKNGYHVQYSAEAI